MSLETHVSAILAGSYEFLRDLDEELATSRVSLSESDPRLQDLTLLMLVAASRDPTVRALNAVLGAGADINAVSAAGMNALSYGIVGIEPERRTILAGEDSRTRVVGSWRSFDAIDHLILAQIDINASDSEGKTPLMHAARNSDYRSVNILLKRGALANVQDHQGQTAFQHAMSVFQSFGDDSEARSAEFERRRSIVRECLILLAPHTDGIVFDPYPEFADHPRYGKYPRLTGVTKTQDSIWWADDKTIAETDVMADLDEQAWCCVPNEVYRDQRCICEDCGRHFIFFADEQKHWFEVLKFNLSAHPVKCSGCRIKDHDRKSLLKRSLELSKKVRTPEESMDLAKCDLKLIELRLVPQRRMDSVRRYLKEARPKYGESEYFKELADQAKLGKG